MTRRVPGEATTTLFNISIKDTTTGVVETFLNVVHEAGAPALRRRDPRDSRTSYGCSRRGPCRRSPRTTAVTPGDDPFDPATTTSTAFGSDGHEGDATTRRRISSRPSPNGQGIYALDKADLFNLLASRRSCATAMLDASARRAARRRSTAHDRRAMFIVDPTRAGTTADDIAGELTRSARTSRGRTSRERGAVLPARPDGRSAASERLRRPSRRRGAVAGVDGAHRRASAASGRRRRGSTPLAGVQELAVKLDRRRERPAQPARRQLPARLPGRRARSSGARARSQGDDRLASEWKYVPVRRTALFLEESLYRGTQWVVFEPNDEPLWAQIRLNVGAFMHNLFRQGAFQGTTPREAYFVKCDGETTTQNDINLGIVNIVVGFAPLKPAEFVVIKIQQTGRPDQVEETCMAQFTVNAQRFDPYKNFKFRVKWDGRYVAGVSKVGALKRTTEVVEHREGGDPRSEPQVARADRSTRRSRSSAASPTTPSSSSGRTRSGTSAPASARRSRSRTSARTSSSRSTTRPASSRSPTRSTAAGSRSTRRCPTSTPTRTPSRSSTSSSRTRAGSATTRCTEPTEPNFTEP